MTPWNLVCAGGDCGCNTDDDTEFTEFTPLFNAELDKEFTTAPCISVLPLELGPTWFTACTDVDLALFTDLVLRGFPFTSDESILTDVGVVTMDCERACPAMGCVPELDPGCETEFAIREGCLSEFVTVE